MSDRKYDLEFLKCYFAWVIQNFKPIVSEDTKKYAVEIISELMS